MVSFILMRLQSTVTPIIIEAGFYSANLVGYLVEVLHMPITQIKYKITTKRALKPDTFKGYIKFIG